MVGVGVERAVGGRRLRTTLGRKARMRATRRPASVGEKSGELEMCVLIVPGFRDWVTPRMSQEAANSADGGCGRGPRRRRRRHGCLRPGHR